MYTYMYTYKYNIKTCLGLQTFCLMRMALQKWRILACCSVGKVGFVNVL